MYPGQAGLNRRQLLSTDASPDPACVAHIGYGLGGRVFHAPLIASLEAEERQGRRRVGGSLGSPLVSERGPHHVVEQSGVFRFHADRGELAGRAVEGESLEKDHLGCMARTVDGDLMPNDHLVAGADEGDGTAARMYS